LSSSATFGQFYVEILGALPFSTSRAFREKQVSIFRLTPPLAKLAAIVRAADTDRLDLAPEAAGLLAASLGLSRMYSDDLEQLVAGMALYDAFYRWARDASDETHDWPTNTPKKQAARLPQGRPSPAQTDSKAK
jgi:hypothetical protein